MNCLPWVQKESNFQLELQLSLVYQMRWNYSQDYQNLSYLWCSRSHIRQYYFQINTLASQNCIEGGYHTIWQDTSRTSKHIVSSQGSEVHCWRTPSTKKCIQVRQPLKRDYDTKSIQNAFQDCIPGWYQQVARYIGKYTVPSSVKVWQGMTNVMMICIQLLLMICIQLLLYWSNSQSSPLRNWGQIM